MTAEEIISALDTLENEEFHFFDNKGIGTVSGEDIVNAVEKFSNLLPAESLKELQHAGDWKDDLKNSLQEFDTDLDGRLTYDEFEEYIKKNSEVAIGTASDELGIIDTQLKEVFNLFDNDKDGYIDSQDMITVLKCMEGDDRTEEDSKEMIARVDTDNDGKISFDNFVNIFNSEPSIGMVENDIANL